VRVATWNVEWATPTSARRRRIAEILRRLEADIIVVTEGDAALLPPDGHLIDGGPDWGYRQVGNRRKVIAWSRSPWQAVTAAPAGALQGRLVIGRTTTPVGGLTVVGVCIPWKDAHVRTGRRDAKPWSEHIEYCQALGPLLDRLQEPVVIAGDFNQMVPRRRQPVDVHGALTTALIGFDLHTTGTTAVGPLIDHIATSTGLFQAEQVTVWPGTDDRSKLSDHAGVAVDLSLAQHANTARP
jgi:endonuclease/exonuclease/phosphatase family metal-dependent hydrolase